MADAGTITARFSATFQGISCRSARAERTPGLESDSYVVEVPAASLAKLSWKTPGAGLFAAAQGGGSGGSAPRGEDLPVTVGGELACRGDLVMRDEIGAPLVFSSLYAREDGIEVVDSGDNDDGPAMARLSLVDVRYFWGLYGELWGRYNVLLPGGKWDRSTLSGEAGVGAGTADGISTGARDTREPFTLLQILRLIADKLPSRPTIGRAPASIADKTPTGLVWEGISPKREMERLLTLYGLTLSLSRRNEIILTDATEPRPPDSASGTARQVGGATLPKGSWRRARKQAFRYRPESVRIVGPRVIREAAVDLIHVGHPRDPKTGRADERRTVIAEEAAKSYELTMEDLAKVVLLPQHLQTLWYRSEGFPETTMADVNRWAFRLYTLPPDARKFLPILQSRALTYLPKATGAEASATVSQEIERPIPPLVEAETFVEERLHASTIAKFARAAGGPGAAGGAGGGTPENAGDSGVSGDAPSPAANANEGGAGDGGDSFGVDESEEVPDATATGDEDVFS